MTIQIELWALITFLVGLLLAFLGGAAGIAKFILAQMEKRLDERFDAQEQRFTGIGNQLSAQEKARSQGHERWVGQFSGIDRQLTDHRERITRLETARENSPSHDDLAELHTRITGLGQSVSSLTGEFQGAKHTLQLIHSFLLQGGRQP
jgi:hypothetical protein